MGCRAGFEPIALITKFLSLLKFVVVFSSFTVPQIYVYSSSFCTHPLHFHFFLSTTFLISSHFKTPSSYLSLSIHPLFFLPYHIPSSSVLSSDLFSLSLPYPFLPRPFIHPLLSLPYHIPFYFILSSVISLPLVSFPIIALPHQVFIRPCYPFPIISLPPASFLRPFLLFPIISLPPPSFPYYIPSSSIFSLLYPFLLHLFLIISLPPPSGTVTFFIQTFFIRKKVYMNFLYTGQSLYGTKFIQDKVYTGTKFIRGQSLYGDKVYTGQSLYGDKVYTRTKFIQTFFILHLNERI
jgi:hypothetical protein